MKTDVNVPSKKHRNKQKTYFLLASCQPLTKKAGTGSVRQWYGSAHPDPYKIVTDNTTPAFPGG
jgi:hypothetical protein